MLLLQNPVFFQWAPVEADALSSLVDDVDEDAIEDARCETSRGAEVNVAAAKRHHHVGNAPIAVSETYSTHECDGNEHFESSEQQPIWSSFS